MITVDQIRSMIQQLILSEVSIDDFEEQLAAESWNMHLDSEADALSMIGKVELLLAEKDAGECSENVFLKNLGLIGGIFEMGDSPDVRVWAAASHPHFFSPFSFEVELVPYVDKQHALEFSYTPLLPA